MRPELIGRASGVANTVQRFGAVFGIGIATAVFDANGSLLSRATATAGYRPALAVAAGFSVVGAAAALVLRAARRPAVATATPSLVTAAVATATPSLVTAAVATATPTLVTPAASPALATPAATATTAPAGAKRVRSLR